MGLARKCLDTPLSSVTMAYPQLLVLLPGKIFWTQNHAVTPGLPSTSHQCPQQWFGGTWSETQVEIFFFRVSSYPWDKENLGVGGETPISAQFLSVAAGQDVAGAELFLEGVVLL